jgi:hypothetical protein
MQGHDVALGRPVWEPAPVGRAGNLVLEERGCLDGATVSLVKRTRRVEVSMPLNAPMLATQEAIPLAELAAKWETYPARAEQRIALGRGVEHLWAECEGPRHAGVMRCWNKQQKRQDPIVLGTTDRQLSAPWIVRHYEERPEIAHDYEHRQSGGWQRKKRSSTRYSEIVVYGLTVVLSYRRYHLFTNTQAGARCADKTRQAIAVAHLRTQRPHIMVDAGGHCDIFEPLSFVQQRSILV